MSQARRVVQNSVIRVGGYALGSALYFAVIVVTSRYLGPEGFGHFAFILALVGSLQLTVDMGVRNILIRDIAVDRARFAERLGVARTLLWALSGVTFGLVVLAANALTMPGDVRQACYLAGAAVIVTFYALGYSAVLRGFEEMEWDILGFVLHKVVYLALTGLAVAGDLGLRGLFAAMLGANGFLYLYYGILVRVLHGRPRLCLSLRPGWRLLVEAFPLGVAEALRRFTWHLDKLLLGLLATPLAVGLYSCGYKFVEAVNPFTANLTLPLYPALSRFAQESSARALAAYERSLKFLFALGVPLAVGLFVLAEPMVLLVFGPAYRDAAVVLRVLAPVAILMVPVSVYAYLFTALGRQRVYTAIVVTGLALKIALALVLIPLYGYVGAAVASVTAEAALYGLGLVMLRRIGELAGLRLLWRPLAAGLAMAALASLVNDGSWLSLAAGTAGGLAVYVGALFLLGTFDRQERALLVDAMRLRFGGAAQ